jgi:hypothetical protein
VALRQIQVSAGLYGLLERTGYVSGAMRGRLTRLRRTGFVLALILSAATFAYSLTGIVSAGDELRDTPSRVSKKRQPPVAYEGCHRERRDSVRL